MEDGWGDLFPVIQTCAVWSLSYSYVLFCWDFVLFAWDPVWSFALLQKDAAPSIGVYMLCSFWLTCNEHICVVSLWFCQNTQWGRVFSLFCRFCCLQEEFSTLYWRHIYVSWARCLLFVWTEMNLDLSIRVSCVGSLNLMGIGPGRPLDFMCKIESEHFSLIR